MITRLNKVAFIQESKIVHYGISKKTKFYKGKDLLLTLKSALINKELAKAKKALKKYYKFYSLSQPDILSGCRLSVGGSVRKIKPIFRNPLISVIITTYNEENYIENAINSILNQSWCNFEIILVDDGSTDNTVSIVKKIASADKRIKMFPLDRNIGVYPARNIGLNHASGELITFQDADDWSHPSRLQMQAEWLISNPLCQATLSKFFRIHSETGLPFAIKVYPFHRLNASSLMFRHSLVKFVGHFDEKTKAGGDSEFIDRIKNLCGDKSLHILQEPLAIGAYRPKSLTSAGEAAILANGHSEYRERYLAEYSEKHKKILRKMPQKARTLVQENTDISAFFIGFSPWKGCIKNWFRFRDITFIKKNMPKWRFNLIEKIRIFFKKNVILFSWGYKIPNFMDDFVKKQKMSLCYIEDGFLRSVKLGAEKQPPCSLTIDTQAPYFDANKRTDLEDLLNHYDFDNDHLLLDRAKTAINFITEFGVSKYNQATPLNVDELYGAKTKKRVLIIGQVEDDASIQYGCNLSVTNEELIKIAHQENPDAQLIYKPHPDVLYGFRKKISVIENLKDKCLIIENDIPLHQSFKTIDHVYTITSLAGLEALLYGIKVTTIGAPFYAGWGMTDTRQATPRRCRKLTTEQIFAATYILYPVYFDYELNQLCEIEDTLRYLSDTKNIYKI